jgi:hypothetical protein
MERGVEQKEKGGRKGIEVPLAHSLTLKMQSLNALKMPFQQVEDGRTEGRKEK